MSASRRLFVGTAGWCVPRASANRFADTGTHLQRYARTMPATEINSSFHRPHAYTTYRKWAAATPAAFRFSVKFPRTITHEGELKRARVPLDRFLHESSGLGRRRGPLLIQLPPSLAFDRRAVTTFLNLVRARYEGPLVCEPRHPSWFTSDVEKVLVDHRVARVAADPSPLQEGSVPGGWDGIIYYRLHGSPRKYWSKYSPEYIETLRGALSRAPLRVAVWCIFDNTASGAALENAWELVRGQTVSAGAPTRASVPRIHSRPPAGIAVRFP